MKTTDITKIIEANPQAIFYHKTSRYYFTIEGFTTTQRTKYATPTKVAITRGVVIRISDDQGTISIDKETRNLALTTIGGQMYDNPEAMRKSQLKTRAIEQATKETRAKRHTDLAEISTAYSTALAHHQIKTTWGTIHADSDHITLKLTIEQAQALLIIIKG
jgi:hypothetical protein